MLSSLSFQLSLGVTIELGVTLSPYSSDLVGAGNAVLGPHLPHHLLAFLLVVLTAAGLLSEADHCITLADRSLLEIDQHFNFKLE